MKALLGRYYEWLHGRWPAGKVEKLPVTGDRGETNVPGLRVVGDLTGIPLLKFSSDTGAKAIQAILEEAEFQGERSGSDDAVDVAIVGGGVSGVSAAIEAKRAGLSYRLFESSGLFTTVANFPKGKPIYTYPTEMTPAGGIQYGERSDVKESLLEEMQEQVDAHELDVTPARIERIGREGKGFALHRADGEVTRARRVVVAIGRSGNFRKLGVPGEEMDKVMNRLHDPKDYCGSRVLVVGGGDSALETAIALAACGAHVTLSYRKPAFSRPKPENLERIQALAENPAAAVAVDSPSSERVSTAAHSSMRGDAAPGSLRLALETQVSRIGENEAVLRSKDGNEEAIKNDYVFAMIGREAPLDFFRRSGIAVAGDRGRKWWGTLALALVIATFIYEWKKPGTWTGIGTLFQKQGWFPYQVPDWLASFGGAFADPANLLGTLRISMGEPGFYYTVVYCVLIVVFGFRRIERRKTPYVTRQTFALMAIQVIPLFLLPYVLFPWMGHNGWFESGLGRGFADEFFPEASYSDHGREYWRAFGFILAWPLFIWNVFTEQPLWGWLAVSLLQTFVIIPLIIWRWGKGAYCGWICSCGAMAETLGDTHRHKMPHGPFWNRLNMIGQVFLALALILLVARVVTWAVPGLSGAFGPLMNGGPGGTATPLSYVWFVDVLWAGILGFGLYFHFSGRVWCRFACPLAALMHVYARFSRFRIFADKKKCISCNVCTSVCHQGIDIMNFANKGLPMEDPECVRCSACVQQCPTGVLSFGRLAEGGKMVLDEVAASPVRMREREAVERRP